MRFFAVALFFFRAAASYSQAPEVPHKMQFAGITLTIRDDARREIQKDVDALTQYPRYFGIKVERAKTYFPTIEKIFAEERLPDDFKFLALQESALVSDAVSVSDAVGFWQFKDFTALEMGLRMDKEVDERMNLISSTRAAAKYLKQNNYMFNNWLYALQSYQMGAGGVQRSVGDQHNGAKHMEITSETYWYVKKYLAHKVAFENALSGEAKVKVIPYEAKSGKSIREIANEVSVEEGKLLEFNKWVKRGIVPSDKSYTILIPAGGVEDFTKLSLAVSTIDKNDDDPAKGKMEQVGEKLEPIWINEIPVVKARNGETLAALIDRAQIDRSSFLKYNDITTDHSVQAGSFYFLARKKTKSQNEFYKTEANEDIWSISQHTGVQLKKLKKYNGLLSDEKIPQGSMVWLKGRKPKDKLMPVTDVVVLVNDKEEFEWDEKLENDSKQLSKVDIGQSKTLHVGDATVQDFTALKTKVPEQIFNYTVKPGETLYSIAKGNNLEVLNLLAWNNLTITDVLKPGQVLRLAVQENGIEANEQEFPTSTQTPNLPTKSGYGGQEQLSKSYEGQVHEVQASDTLYSVARKYGVTIKELMDWNQKLDLSLTVGEKLRIMQK